MTPNLIPQNQSNHPWGNSKSPGQGRLIGFSNRKTISYFQNLDIGKLAGAILLAFKSKPNPATLLVHVRCVFCLRAGADMVRIAAKRVSNAIMQCVHSSRNVVPICYYPCQSVRGECGLLTKPANGKRSVFSRLGVCNPRPAFVCVADFHSGPKPSLEFIRKKLFQKLRRYNFGLHSVSRLIVCHALGHANDARALYFSTGLQPCQLGILR